MFSRAKTAPYKPYAEASVCLAKRMNEFETYAKDTKDYKDDIFPIVVLFGVRHGKLGIESASSSDDDEFEGLTSTRLPLPNGFNALSVIAAIAAHQKLPSSQSSVDRILFGILLTFST